LITRLLIASTLKPVEDARQYYKIAVSLSQTNKYEIKIIGAAQKNISENHGISLSPIKQFRKGSLLRPFWSIIYLFHALQFKPKIQIICTWELLLPAVIISLINKSKIIYDLQENYAANVMQLQGKPSVFSRLKSSLIRFHEWAAKPRISAYFAAEMCYIDELHLDKSKCFVLENKALPFDSLNKAKIPNKIIFSGTLGKSQGVFDAIEWYWKLKNQQPEWTITIIGHCPYLQDLEKLQALCAKDSSIILKASDQPMPYPDILSEIHSASIGILAYQPHQATQNKMPTKLFEYLAYGLQIVILNPNPKWEKLLNTYQAGLVWNNQPENFEEVKSWLTQSSEIRIAPELYWDSKRVMSAMDTIK
jgi:hypothetical protein